MEKLIRKRTLYAIITGLLVLQATTTFSQLSTAGRLKNLPANPPELDQEVVLFLPFEEDWSAGIFETGKWTRDINSNWRIAGQAGNNAPSAEFFYNPAISNYQHVLTSSYLNARSIIDGNIYITFDIKLANILPTGTEFLKIQVSTDTVWNTIMTYSNLYNYDWSHIKREITDSVKGNIFRIRFLAEGQNSLNIFNWMIDNISVYRVCASPENFKADVNFPHLDETILEWDPPSVENGEPAWLTWDDGINNDGIGLTIGGTFSVAARFTIMQLGEYAGTSLSKIRFFAYAEGTFELKVWIGLNANQLILSQPLNDITIGTWNEVTLDTPIYITGDSELWFGYTVTHSANNSPAGVDNGPAIVGYGDMISLDGNVWESMSTAYALNYNWNLEGLVEYLDNNQTGQDPQFMTPGSRKQEDLVPDPTNNNIKNRSLLYYNIYKNGILLDTTSATTYIDYTYEYMQTACYIVNAVYTDCLSEFTNEDCVLIYNRNTSELIDFYPVPADQSLTIEIKKSLNSLIISNFYNRTIYQKEKPGEGSFTINTSAYPNGFYLIRSMDYDGNISTDKFIINH